jgi:hopanoid biosynthesis associated RND transporter like protein HpnN
LVLRNRKLTIMSCLVAGVASLFYAGQNLGINTDTADMISADLAWRQDFIAYRERFPARDRNILIVIDSRIPEQADELAAAIADGLRGMPALFDTVFLAGDGEFFDRNGLLYLSVPELEALTESLAEAQPLLGRLQQRFDGAQLFSMLAELAERGEQSADASQLYTEVAAAADAAANGSDYTVSWQRVLQGEADSVARRFILLQPQLDFTRARPAADAMAGIQALIADLQPVIPTGSQIRVTGTLAMEHEELSSVTRGAGVAGLAALAMVALVLYVALQSFVVLAIAVLTLVIGLAVTAAFAAAAVGHLNLLSVAFAVLYIGLGVDFILHVCLRLRELRSRGGDREAAIIETMTGVGTSLVICTVTTAAGFFSFIPTSFSGVSELGLISGTGMFISLLFSVTLLPALLVQFNPVPAGGSAAPSWSARCLDPVARRPRIVVAITLIVTLGGAALLPKASFDRNPVNLRDPASESVRTLQDLAASGEALPLHMMALAPDNTVASRWIAELEALSTVKDVRSLDDLIPAEQQEKLLLLEDLDILLGPNFADVEHEPADPTDLRITLEEMNERLTGSSELTAAAAELNHSVERLLAALELRSTEQQQRALLQFESGLLSTLPRQLQILADGLSADSFDREDLPAELVSRWVAVDGTELLEVAPERDISDDELAEQFVASVRATVSAATGLPVVHQESGRTVVRAFQLAFIYALVMVSIILWIFLRRVGDSLLVLIPVVIAAGLTAALTVLLGLQFNFANIIALPLLLGVGVDNGIHLVHRMRTEPPADGRLIATSTSRAVFASGLTTIASFGNLAFASHLGMASMGQLLTLGMIMTLVATLILLPALLSLRPTV